MDFWSVVKDKEKQLKLKTLEDATNGSKRTKNIRKLPLPVFQTSTETNLMKFLFKREQNGVEGFSSHYLIMNVELRLRWRQKL